LFLIQEAEEGIQHFLKGNLSHFDPHVGDTACHIRACYFSYLWINREEIFICLERDRVLLKVYAEKVVILIDQSRQGLHRPLRPSFLNEFLQELNVNLSLYSASLDVIISHLLSKYAWIDEKGMPQSMDESLVIRTMKESVAFSSALIRNMQRKLSFASTEFMIFLAKLLVEKKQEINSLPTLLPFLIEEDGCRRMQLPCISAFELIATFIRSESRITIVWMVDFINKETREIFIFKADEQGKWKPLSLIDIEEKSPIFLIRAATFLDSRENFLSWVLSCGVDSILCWFGAVHPQYTGGKEVPFPSHYQYFFENSYQLGVSQKIGLTPKNHENLIIRHIFVCEKAVILQKIKSLPVLYKSNEHEIFNLS
jgi:hypothetical protein